MKTTLDRVKPTMLSPSDSFVERHLPKTDAENFENFSSVHAALMQSAEKVDEDDILMEDDALLLEGFLEVLKDLNGEEAAQTVSCRKVSIFVRKHIIIWHPWHSGSISQFAE